MKSNKIANAAMAVILGTGLVVTTTSTTAEPKEKNVEKCYGISKAKMNDCGTPEHACAGQAKTNNDPQEWIYVLKGNCKRIVGGSTEPPESESESS